MKFCVYQLAKNKNKPGVLDFLIKKKMLKYYQWLETKQKSPFDLTQFVLFKHTLIKLKT